MIVNNIEEVRKYLPVNINNSFDVIKPYILGAEPYVLKVLGVEQWEKLQDDYNDEIADADHLALLQLAQMANVHFAYLDFSSDGNLQINDNGLINTENANEKPVYQWQKLDFRAQRFEKGWDTLERLFGLLNSKQDVYTLWANSDTYAVLKGNFIFTAADFSKYRTIKGFNTLFALRGAMTEAEADYIFPAIGREFYDELKSQVLEDSVTADNEPVLKLIKEAVAHLAIQVAGEELQFSLTSSGLQVVSIETQSTNVQKTAFATDSQMATVVEKSRLKAQQALETLTQFLNTNASNAKYPLYYNSGLHTAIVEGESGKHKNNQGSTFSKMWF